MVPAVTEVCLPQPANSQVHGLAWRPRALIMPQPRQTKPCGQSAAKRYLAQAASSAKRCWNSIGERAKSVTAGHPERPMFAIRSITPHTPPQPMVSPDVEAESFANNKVHHGFRYPKPDIEHFCLVHAIAEGLLEPLRYHSGIQHSEDCQCAKCRSCARSMRLHARDWRPDTNLDRT